MEMAMIAATSRRVCHADAMVGGAEGAGGCSSNFGVVESYSEAGKGFL